MPEYVRASLGVKEKLLCVEVDLRRDIIQDLLRQLDSAPVPAVTVPGQPGLGVYSVQGYTFTCRRLSKKQDRRELDEVGADVGFLIVDMTEPGEQLLRALGG
ncbi:hypothetical protein [Longispora urticae]